jgi:hypothetical protein
MRRLLVLLICGCSSPPAMQVAPIIDKLDEPAMVTLDAMGKATLNGMLQFHDDDNAVTSMIFRLPATKQETTAVIPRASVGLVAVTTVISGTKNTQIAYEVEIVDETGLKSTTEKRSVLLQ